MISWNTIIDVGQSFVLFLVMTWAWYQQRSMNQLIELFHGQLTLNDMRHKRLERLEQLERKP